MYITKYKNNMSNTKNLKCKSCENIVKHVGKDATSVTCSSCVNKQIANIEKLEMESEI